MGFHHTQLGLGIDIGASAIKVAWRNTDDLVQALNFDGIPYLSSVFYFPSENNDVLFGKDAQNRYEQDPTGGFCNLRAALERNATIRINAQRQIQPLELLVHLFLYIKKCASEEIPEFNGQLIEDIVLTLSGLQNESIQSLLKRAANKIGWTKAQIASAPVAVAQHWRNSNKNTSHDAIIVIDCGATATHWTYLKHNGKQFELIDNALHNTIHLGGRDVDTALLERLGETHPELYATASEPQLREKLRQYKEVTLSDDNTTSVIDFGNTCILEDKNSVSQLFQDTLLVKICTSLSLFLDSITKQHPDIPLLLVGGCVTTLLQKSIRDIHPYVYSCNQPRHGIVFRCLARPEQAYFGFRPISPVLGSIQQITMNPNGTGDFVDLELAVTALAENGTLYLQPGEYKLQKPLIISKPLILRGGGMNTTCISCSSEEFVVMIKSNKSFEASGVHFKHTGELAASVLLINNSEINIWGCRFDGAVTDDSSSYGHGIIVAGECSGKVSESHILDNPVAGIFLNDELANVGIIKNECTRNKLGIIIKAENVFVSGNQCNHNGSVGIYIDDNAKPVIRDNQCSHNKVYGIFFSESANGQAEENLCFGNEAGIVVSDSAYPLLLKNNCSDNTGDGIRVLGRAKPTIESNYCKNNQEDGIWYKGNASGISRLNQCIGNIRSGIRVTEQAAPTLDKNFCEKNSGNGIVYGGHASGEVRFNSCSNNTVDGIGIFDEANPLVAHNQCEGNSDSGIYYSGTTAGTALNNKCISNSNYGIYLNKQAQPALENNICKENHSGIHITESASPSLVQNRCLDNVKNGIVYTGDASGTARENNCSDNGLSGIYVGGNATPLLEDNRCENNENCGIAYWGNASGKAKNNYCHNNGVENLAVSENADPKLKNNIY